MSYTPEQLREDAHRADGIGTMADGDQLRAHADALEENARLRAERDTHVAVTERIKVALRIQGTGSYVEWASRCRDALDKLERAEAELAKLRQAIDLAARAMGGEDVNDQGEAWDKCLRILDAARADFPEGKK